MNQEKYIYQLDIKVRDYELDAEKIVNNANYLHYLEFTRHCFCEEAGYSFKQMVRDGIIPVMARIEADYKQPLRSGDTMTSRLWIERDGVKMLFHQHIINKTTGADVLHAKVWIVCLENGKLTRGDKLAEAFKAFLK